MSRVEEAMRRVAGGLPRETVVQDALASLQGEGRGQSPVPYPSAATENRGKRIQQHPVGTPRRSLSSDRFPADLAGKLVLSHAAPMVIEQYRRLAATLHDLQATHGTKTLMVASALPRDGKTLTVTNLALTLSEAYGRRVLLIDADLRRPTIHEIFKLPNVKGLSEGLRSERESLSLLSVTPLLSVLPAGQPGPNPMAGLTSERMRILIEEAAAVYDWVLLDAPPVGIMPDANLLVRLTEGVIFVIAAGLTPYSLVARAVDEIGRENIVGTVLNRIDPENMPATMYYDRYYQDVSD
jgi:capsular exopolysaccharide synthesis family protein